MGQDAGMDASPSWQDLKDERDALRADKRMAEWRDQRWRTQILAKECKKLKAERDELAAHVERLTQLVSYVMVQFDKAERGEPLESDEDAFTWADRARSVVKESPVTSLARLKAQWQADALEQALDDSDDSSVWAVLRNRIEELRRQNEDTV